MVASELPHVDEHSIVIAADVNDVWAALTATVDRAFAGGGRAAYARAVGCSEVGASGPRPLTEGSSIPGFRVAAAVPPAMLTLAGRHRFSTYALIFRIEEAGAGRSRLRAETRAAFPGAAGGAYRLLVIGIGLHVIAVRRLLSAVKDACESAGDLGPVDRVTR